MLTGMLLLAIHVVVRVIRAEIGGMLVSDTNHINRVTVVGLFSRMEFALEGWITATLVNRFGAELRIAFELLYLVLVISLILLHLFKIHLTLLLNLGFCQKALGAD